MLGHETGSATRRTRRERFEAVQDLVGSKIVTDRRSAEIREWGQGRWVQSSQSHGKVVGKWVLVLCQDPGCLSQGSILYRAKGGTSGSIRDDIVTMIKGAVNCLRRGVAGEILPDKRSKLTSSPSGKAAIYNSNCLFTMTAAPSSNRLEDDAVEGKHSPYRSCPGFGSDALQFQGQL
jgi:hypothetical protein